MIKNFINKKTATFGIALIVTVLLSAILQLAWPALIFSVVTLTLFLPLPARVSKSISLRIILSIMLVLSAIQLEAVVGYMLKIDLNPLSYAIANALLATALAIFAPRSRTLKWTLDDSWTFLVPILVVGGLVLSMVFLTTKPNTDINSAIIHKITTTSDESNHLNVFAQAIAVGGDIETSPLSYPTGWHIATATVVSSFVNLSDKPFMDTATAYYVMKMLGVFLVVASIMALLTSLSRLILKDHQRYYLLFGLTGLFLCLSLIIPNSEINGFYNFVPQYAYFLLTFLLLLHVKGSLKMVLPIVSIFIMGGFMSWIISGLLLFGIVVVSVLAPIFAKAQLKNQLLASLLQFGILGALLLGVFVVSLPGGTVGGLIDTLEHPGGWIEGYNLITYPVVLLLLIACGVLTSKSKIPLQFRAGLITFFILVGIVFIVTTLRGYGGDQMSYYWQKMLFPLLPVAISVLVVLAAQKLRTITKHIVPVYAIVVLSMVLLASSVIGHQSFDLSLRVIGNQTFLHKTKDLNLTNSLVTLFENNTFKSETVDRYVFITSPNFTLDQMVYQLMSRSITDSSSDVAGNSSCFPTLNANGGFYGENLILLKDIESEYCGHKVKIIVSNETINDVKTYKPEAELINIDDI